MANSKFEYVRSYEVNDACLPNCWIVVRLDGKSFHRFSDVHSFRKPNDERALRLMGRCAMRVMAELSDVVIAYGQSDEFSFVFHRRTAWFGRRASKLMTHTVSLFASSFVFHWLEFFGETVLRFPPTFDARVVLFPTDRCLRDYLSWRQADCHINNLYNTTFWALVQKGGLSPSQAQERLKGTMTGDKNEILFSEFGTNYNKEPEVFRKGTTLIWQKAEKKTVTQLPKTQVSRLDELGSASTYLSKSQKRHRAVVALNVDIIGEDFWQEHQEILAD
uniref:tRNA(His) guanylyltransferase n=1 Tax=Eptatretus burgeri TaxID=7764 RepID=A0A8C4Q403_EPTBU